MTGVPPPPGYGAGPGGAQSPPTGAALSYGFNKYFANIGPVLLVILVAFVAQLVVTGIELSITSLFGRLLLNIVGLVVNAVVGIGIYQAALMVTRGETVTVGKAFSYDRWGEWIVFSIVFGLMIGLGLLLCIIPGLVLLAWFGMAPFFFLDQRMSLGDALAASRQAASSRGFAIPVLLSVLVGVAGVIACGIGVLVTAPAAYIAVAFLYRNAAGQTVAP